MTFAQRRPLPQPEAGQTLFSGREKEIGLYRLHFHRSKKDPQVRLITSIVGPGGAGKTRLLDELEWYDSAQTIYCRVDNSAGFGQDGVRLLQALAAGLHREGEAIATPQFDQLLAQRQKLLQMALTRSRDPKALLHAFYRPTLLGLTALGLAEPVLATVSVEQFADLQWRETELALAFENPIGLLTQALIADFNQMTSTINGSIIKAEPTELNQAEQQSQSNEALAAAPAPPPVDVVKPAPPNKIVLMFDTYETVRSVVEEWLLTYLLGYGREAIGCDLRLVLASRDDLFTADNRWQQQWADHILTLSLAPLTTEEIADFSKKNAVLTDLDAGVDSASNEETKATWPLWLNVAKVAGVPVPLDETTIEVGSLLAEPQKSWLTQAALAGRFDQKRLSAINDDDDSRSAFQWLVGQQGLVRVTGGSGHFRLDRTLAQRLLQESADDLATKRQKLLECLDEELKTVQKDLQRSTPHRTQAEYHALILERMRHTLATGDGTESSRFLQTSFLQALASHTPLMFDLLALLSSDAESLADSEELGRQITTLPTLQNLATAWLQGQWSEMQTTLTDMIKVEQLSPEHRATAYNWLGYSYRSCDDQDRALRIYDQGLDLYTDDRALRSERGLANFAAGHYEVAITDLSQALPGNGSSSVISAAVIYHIRGLACAQVSDYTEAIDDYSQTLRLDPDNGAVFSDRGLAFAKQGNHERAIEDYNQALKLNPKDATAYFYRGQAQSDLGAPTEAIENYTQAINLRPTYGEAFQERGTAYIKQGETDKAISDFNRAIQLSPKEASNYRQRGLAYIEQGEFERAVHDFDHAIQLNPADGVSYFNLGLANMQQSDPGRAIRNFDRALELVGPTETKPEYYVTAFAQRGLAYTQSPFENFERAIENFDRAIALTPEDALLHYQRGVAYAQQEKYSQAIEDYQQAIHLNPKFALAFYSRGLVYNHQADYSRAIEDFDQVIELAEESSVEGMTTLSLKQLSRAHQERGLAYFHSENNRKAIADFDRAVELDDTNAAAYRQRGEAYLLETDYPSAIEDYNRALVLAEDDAESFIQRGRAFAAQDDFSRALEDYNQAIKLNPDSDRAFYYRGCVFADHTPLGSSVEVSYQRAIEDFSQALFLNPKRAQAFYRRGAVYLKIQDYRQAIENFDQAVNLKLDPKSKVTILQNRGLAFLEQQEYAKAIDDFNQVVTLDAQVPQAYYHRGRARMAQKDYARAVEDYNQALSLEPNNPWTLFYRGQAHTGQANYERAVEDYNQALALEKSQAPFIIIEAWPKPPGSNF